MYSSNNEKNQIFAFYITDCLFPHKISSQSCVVNFSFTLAFKLSLMNGETPEILFILKGGCVFKRIAKRKIHP